MTLDHKPNLHFNFENIFKVDQSEKSILGIGGGGTVELIRHKSDPTQLFALKTIPILKGGISIRIESELRLHKAMDHPQIVRLLGSQFRKNEVLIFLEYVPGGDLFHMLHNSNGTAPQLTFSNKLKIFIETVRAVDYMHRNGVIHRDLKLENILLTDDLGVKICDFGWAIEMDHPTRRMSESGTVEYMAPEIFQRTPQTAKVDIWALGNRF